jgi:nitrite reductase (NO-forming)
MNRTVILAVVGTLTLGISAAQADIPSNAAQYKHVVQEMLPPPFLPKHEQVVTGDPVVVEVNLDIIEKESIIDNIGTVAQTMTFNGTVPGPMIVVHEGDYVQLKVTSVKSNKLVHNIDLHAVTGALGGGEFTMVAPGQEAIIRFKATKAGVFVYHCAPGGVMIPYHVVSGMNGAIMVLPRDGLKDNKGKSLTYDRAYYIGEQDFYIPKTEDGHYKQYASPSFAMVDTMKVMATNNPSHVVFNGAEGALTGANAMTASVGDKVLFIHSQANRDTRPHLIGGHGDYVWAGGSFNDAPQTNLETWSIAGGAAGAMMYEFKQPGLYAYVNHNLIDAAMKGAAAHVQVRGEWNNDLLEQIEKPTPY